jgi:hypothetical protein
VLPKRGKADNIQCGVIRSGHPTISECWLVPEPVINELKRISMRVEVNQHTLREIADDYEAAVVWVASIGFPVERGRLAEYRRTITHLATDVAANGWGDLNDDKHRERVCTALLEVRELVSIHRGLATVLDSEATKGIHHYLKGPFSPTNELAHNSSNRPRNIGFELYLNALFAFAGFRPTYGSAADLSFVHMDQTYFIEAKRPTNANAAKGLISDANGQLYRRLKNLHSHGAKGFIALDLTKVINPQNKIMPVFDEEHLYKLMFNEDKRQIDALRSFWHSGRHPRVVGVLLHYRLLTNFVHTGALNTVKWIGFVNFIDDQSLIDINTKLEVAIPLVC